MQEKFKNMKKLCLSMIVKNEMVNLERCLSSVADHIDCWVIGDTGSTDGTQDFIRAFFAKRGLPGELHSFPFVNFEQARNDALRRAYDSELEFDYLLLADADMELVVEDLGFRAKLEGPGYQLMQRAGSGLVYWNARLVRRDVGAWYHGVTHEYLDVPGGVTRLTGLWYKDHASGANRVDKFERDIRLLMEALKLDPGNVRYHFYLAQSYRDAGRKQEAADAYAQRADMGGWDEEVWAARRQQALCLRDLGDESGFRQAALAAFNLRPQRAEPLYDLAHHYRIKGWNDVSTLFSERGMEIAIPKDDILFVEEWIYRYGLREEFSISANYARDADRKDRGFAACEWLALNRDIPAGPRELAFSNLQYYVQPINQLLPSFVTRQLEFTPPEGFKLLNPSVARCGEDIFVCQRAINYGISEDGSTYETANGEPVQMRNFLLRLDEALRTRSCAQILLPEQAADQQRRRLAPLGGLAAILLERQLVVRRDRPRSVPSSIGRSDSRAHRRRRNRILSVPRLAPNRVRVAERLAGQLDAAGRGRSAQIHLLLRPHAHIGRERELGVGNDSLDLGRPLQGRGSSYPVRRRLVGDHPGNAFSARGVFSAQIRLVRRDRRAARRQSAVLLREEMR